MSEPIDVCASEELAEGGLAVSFDVVYRGESCRAFAVRFEGRVFAYLNRCTHVAMEMDYQPNRFFDDTGQWLLCATHGAAYAPDTGACAGGPCSSNLVRLDLHEAHGRVCWTPTADLQAVNFD
ncbi:2Fe-2S ferredoxin [Comamonas serinivorans]|uniref:2Fe-2S ferredoxin n=1 Tax=Comamonas serinivorans TaxID=1082851 RepID=A0A1Y0EQX9_9BURK|nr:Rieske 2Fe-2S domain-containing protein [Comamonas serinivorans]ARU05830.1 2Fe-2S ferredoxin [Comamonas serinivorans]